MHADFFSLKFDLGFPFRPVRDHPGVLVHAEHCLTILVSSQLKGIAAQGGWA